MIPSCSAAFPLRFSYAEGYQKKRAGYYLNHPMTESTKQAVIVLASFFMKAGTVLRPGFFSDLPMPPNRSGDSTTLLQVIRM